MSSKPNILFIASWYPSEVSPQAGNFIRNHAQTMADSYNIAVIHAVSRKQEESVVIVEKKINNVYEVIAYYKKTTGRGLFSQRKKYKAQLEAYSLAYQKAKEQMGSFALTHLNVTFPAGLFAQYLKKTESIPYLITEHWTAFLDRDPINLKGIQKLLIKQICRHADAICPVSKDLMKAMQNFGIKGDFHVIPNVVDTDTFKPKAKKPNHVKTIVHVSNLKDEHKNISGILHSIKKLSERRSDFKLIIAGNGDIEYFHNKSIEYKIPKDLIEFKGEQSTQEVATLMQLADFFLLFSHYENLPCVIAEAHCCGIPVLSSDVGGINEMIDHTNGVLIQADNNVELLNQLNYMLDNLAQFNHEEIAANAANQYGPEAVEKSYQLVYQNILN